MAAFLEWTTTFLLIMFCSVIVALICYHQWRICVHKEFLGKTTLFVTAHPDDECMFFAPTILKFARYGRVFLLCLSTGNHRGMGNRRKEELLVSCSILGIPMENISILDDKKLQDDPKAVWDTHVIREAIETQCKAHNVGMVVTFDNYGVSGHPNHIAIFHAINTSETRTCLHTNKIPVYVLKSVSIFRKYISILDLANSLFTRHVFLSSFQDISSAQKAMASHQSQYVWFRRLYVIFSRYMIINTLERIRDLEYPS